MCEHHWTGDVCSVCPKQFAGANCDECAARFSGPSCDVCQGGYQKPDCAVCGEGWSGPNCDVAPTASSAVRYALITAGVLVVLLLALLAVLAIRRYRRKQNERRDTFAMTNLGTPDEDDEFFDDTLTDAAPARLLQTDFNLRLSDDEADL